MADFKVEIISGKSKKGNEYVALKVYFPNCDYHKLVFLDAAEQCLVMNI